MATNLVKATEGTAIVWANTSDYSDTVSGRARTAQLDLTSLAAGAARQGAKVDFGATRHDLYLVAIAVEFTGTSGTLSRETIDVYHASSPSGTAGNANPGGTSGADAAYTGTSGDSMADSLLQLDKHIGSLVTTTDDTTVVQYQVIGTITGAEMQRYGMPVVFNNATGALLNDAVEMYVAYIPVNPDIQAAA